MVSEIDSWNQYYLSNELELRKIIQDKYKVARL